MSALGSTSGSSSPMVRRPTRFASSPSDESSASCADISIDQCGDTALAMHGQWQLGGSSEAPRAVRVALQRRCETLMTSLQRYTQSIALVPKNKAALQES